MYRQPVSREQISNIPRRKFTGALRSLFALGVWGETARRLRHRFKRSNLLFGEYNITQLDALLWKYWRSADPHVRTYQWRRWKRRSGFFFFFSHPFLASSRCTRQKRETSCGPIWREFTYFKNVKPILVHNDESLNKFNFTNLFVCVVYSGECLRHTNEKRKTSCSFWRACTRPSKRNLFFFFLIPFISF